VGVAAAHERPSEQYDVVLYLNPESADYGYRLRVDHRDQDDVGADELLAADVDGVEVLRITGYGVWAQCGLAAALRRATGARCLPGRSRGRDAGIRPRVKRVDRVGVR
jgi:hypothetical protein